jgi:hypothetical protein
VNNRKRLKALGEKINGKMEKWIKEAKKATGFRL